MESSKYTNTSNTGASGLLGKPDMQAKFGTQFIPTGRFSVQGNREFDTYSNAEIYIQTNASAFPGIIVTVSNDTTANNGVYLVENSEATESNPNGLKMTKLAQGGDAQEKLEWSNYTDESFEDTQEA